MSQRTCFYAHRFAAVGLWVSSVCVVSSGTHEAALVNSSWARQESSAGQYLHSATVGEISSLSSVRGSSPLESVYCLRAGYIGQNVDPVSLRIELETAVGSVEFDENVPYRVWGCVLLDDTSERVVPLSDLFLFSSANCTLLIKGGSLSIGPVLKETLCTLAFNYRDLSTALNVRVLDRGNRYADWQQHFFSASELAENLRTNPDDSFTDDGFSNLLKYAFDIGPREAMTTSPGPLMLVSQEASLSLSFSTFLRSDINYLLERSFDLDHWVVVWSGDGIRADILLSHPRPEQGPVFYRLRADRLLPPP